jgi:carboxypeptidase Taq
LRRLAHEKFTTPAIGELLDDLQPFTETLPYDSDEASLVRVTRRLYERAVKVPPAFMAEFSRHSAASYAVWESARPADDFAAVQPYLARTLDLSRQYAEFFPGYEHIADPLIDIREYGMTAAKVRAVFSDLRQQLAPIVEVITAHPPADDSCLRQRFPEADQLAFGLEVIKRFGYDFERGREDNYLGDALFGSMHEAGHGMYEQGIQREFEGTPLARGTTSGVHESQSRLWENIVGRGRAFWEFFYPRLQTVFPDQLGAVGLDTFYRAVNKVERSLIRTGADEVTYNLHVMMRFDFELDLLEGHLPVRDLPEAWRERFQADLGIVPSDDCDGVLQDVHWYGGLIGGAFQGYTLGNVLSAQFFEAALRGHPQLEGELRAGQFQNLHAWLKENIYQHGRKFTAAELVERVTGGPLDTAPYIRYLRGKYSELYSL